jgi:ribonuclease HI
MSESDVLTIYTDGAARGNPGPAAFAYVLRRPGAADVEEKGRLGEATNNVAEYTALVRALEHARRLGARRVAVYSDSELMVRQMNGEYKVKHEGLRPLYEKAVDLSRQFDSFKIVHVRRGQNDRADALCNEALDGGPRPKPTARAPSRPAAPARADGKAKGVREEAVECLRAVAVAWARGNPNDPKPEDVWEQLWTILEDGGVLRSYKRS